MNKCFEAINLLQFTERQEVVGMISPEKEIVPFDKSIDVNEGDKKGNVEKWLLEIENEMRNCLRAIAKRSIEDRCPRMEWVVKYPAMITLMGDMMIWTTTSEVALDKAASDPKSMPDHYARLNSELSDIVQMVRTDLGELDRMTLGAMVFLDLIIYVVLILGRT